MRHFVDNITSTVAARGEVTYLCNGFKTPGDSSNPGTYPRYDIRVEEKSHPRKRKRLMIVRFLFIIALAVSLVACSPASTNPTPTAVPPEATPNVSATVQAVVALTV